MILERSRGWNTSCCAFLHLHQRRLLLTQRVQAVAARVRCLLTLIEQTMLLPYSRLNIPLRSLALLALVAGIFVAPPGFAGNQRAAKATVVVEKRAAKAYFSEADGFLGLKFGVPLVKQLPECVDPVYGQPDPEPVFCYAALSEGELGYAQLEQPPDIGLGYSAIVLLWNGSVEDVCLRFRRADFTHMLKSLMTRFGQPRVMDAAAVYEYSGDLLHAGKVYEWAGSRVNVQLSEYGDSPRESRLVVATNRYLRALHE